MFPFENIKTVLHFIYELGTHTNVIRDSHYLSHMKTMSFVKYHRDTVEANETEKW